MAAATAKNVRAGQVLPPVCAPQAVMRTCGNHEATRPLPKAYDYATPAPGKKILVREKCTSGKDFVDSAGRATWN
ncbi:hypothetical protein [Denitromonas sp.]|uniref:hypothetical protein n=1 Tax=Denitromonas sp. TaxID=2734609 RepID=UPI003A84B2C0